MFIALMKSLPRETFNTERLNCQSWHRWQDRRCIIIRHNAARLYKQVLYTKHRQWRKHHFLKLAHMSEGIYRVAIITITI
jgi:hypothetical protein